MLIELALIFAAIIGLYFLLRPASYNAPFFLDEQPSIFSVPEEEREDQRRDT